MWRSSRRLGRVIFVLSFLVAIFALSTVFASLRDGSLAGLLLSIAALAAAIVCCGFFIYADERTKGNVRKSVALYERILAWQAEGQTKKQS
jgi:hypothetical protein